MGNRHQDKFGARYCDSLLKLQDRCEQLGLNFRLVMIGLVESWLQENPGKDNEDDQARRSERDA